MRSRFVLTAATLSLVGCNAIFGVTAGELDPTIGAAAGAGGAAAGVGGATSGSGGVVSQGGAGTGGTSSQGGAGTGGTGGTGAVGGSAGKGGSAGACMAPGAPCLSCLQTKCDPAWKGCGASNICQSFLACEGTCACGDQQCEAKCASQAEVPATWDVLQCGHDQCPMECGSGPSCGFVFGKQTCNDCLAGSCCGQGIACAGNPDCLALAVCVLGCGGGMACVQDCTGKHPMGGIEATYLIQCEMNHCTDACMGAAGGAGGAGGGAGAGGAAAGGSAGAGGGSAGAGAVGGAGGGTAGSGGSGPPTLTCAWNSTPTSPTLLATLTNPVAGELQIERFGTDGVRLFVSTQNGPGGTGQMTMYNLSKGTTQLVSTIDNEQVLATARYATGVGVLTAHGVGGDISLDIIEIPDNPASPGSFNRVWSTVVTGYSGANRGFLVRNGTGWVLASELTALGGASVVRYGRTTVGGVITTSTVVDGMMGNVNPRSLLRDAAATKSYVYTDDPTATNAALQYVVDDSVPPVATFVRAIGNANGFFAAGQALSTGTTFSVLQVDDTSGPFRTGIVPFTSAETFDPFALTTQMFDLALFPQSDFAWHDTGSKAQMVGFGASFGDKGLLSLVILQGDGVRALGTLGPPTNVTTLQQVHGTAVPFQNVGNLTFATAAWTEITMPSDPIPLYTRSITCQ
jgi:hypothetical protein